MLILGIDPGLESPGYAVWSPAANGFTWIDSKLPAFPVDVAAVESGWTHGKMGKLSMWGLGFNARGRIDAVTATDKYTVSPDHWRAALPKRPGQLTIDPRLPKATIVARLRLRYGMQCADTWTDDMVEACGIAEGVAALLARPLKKDRRGLVAVRDFG